MWPLRTRSRFYGGCIMGFGLAKEDIFMSSTLKQNIKYEAMH
jgi:hypothetical protein